MRLVASTAASVSPTDLAPVASAAVIEPIEDMPEGTLGFRVSGRLERADYTEVLQPALKDAVEQDSGLRSLYLIDKLEWMDPGALWEDAKTSFDLSVANRADWQRTAVVTDQNWLAEASTAVCLMVPGEFKTFPVAELEPAKAWVAGQRGRLPS